MAFKLEAIVSPTWKEVEEYLVGENFQPDGYSAFDPNAMFKRCSDYGWGDAWESEIMNFHEALDEFWKAEWCNKDFSVEDVKGWFCSENTYFIKQCRMGWH